MMIFAGTEEKIRYILQIKNDEFCGQCTYKTYLHPFTNIYVKYDTNRGKSASTPNCHFVRWIRVTKKKKYRRIK